MKAASIVNEAYCIILIETMLITRRTKMQYSTWHQCIGIFLCPSAQTGDGTTHS